MAVIKLDREKLRTNFHFLDRVFKERGIEWGVVSKVLCGSPVYLQELIGLGVKEIHDSRISNLAQVKEIDPTVQTVYIKPPAKGAIEDIVQHADVSFNTEYQTIKTLSEEAQRQNKRHKIIIMIELGDLREGVMGSELIDFYGRIFELPNIEVVGLGTNLNCMYGVMPSEDKLIQLSLYKQLIEAKFDRHIPWVSGGTSIVLPLLFKKRLPGGINHFRIGETLYFGNDLFHQAPIEGMETDVFHLHAEIIELTKKPKVPTGEIGEDPQGETYEIDEEDYGKSSYRAILDIDPEYIEPEDENITIAGASSDMLIMDVGESSASYQVGDEISFKIRYMGLLGLLNSNYISQEVE
jgi:predicted amino acid racemase